MTPNRKPIAMARALRQRDVPAEAILWRTLRNRKLGGFKFPPQHPIAAYPVDFACVECKVVVEADGKSHLTREAEDEKRRLVIEGDGWLILRFWNTEIYDELEAVREAIYRVCCAIRDTGSPPTPLPV